MLSSKWDRLLFAAGRKLEIGERNRFSPVVTSFLPTILASHVFDQYRSFSDDSEVIKPPSHKQIIPPMPEPPMPEPSFVIVEPPVRSRPYRQLRGSRRFFPGSRRFFPQNPSTRQGYGTYPVQAVHAAQSIDLAAIASKVFAAKGARRMMERHSVVVQLPSDEDDEKNSPRFVAVFRFGSVVSFNVAPRDVSDILLKIRKYSTDPVLTGNEMKENFCVHVQPEVPDDGDVVTGEYCIVQEMNMKSVDVISNIMAQSVALDSYNEAVDELLAEFEKINGAVTGSGDLKTVDKDTMFRAVARNNNIFIEMVSRVGIKDRVDTAWNLSQYEK